MLSIEINTGGPLTDEQEAALDAHIAAIRARNEAAMIARFGMDITDEQAQAAGFRSRDHLAKVCWAHAGS